MGKGRALLLAAALLAVCLHAGGEPASGSDSLGLPGVDPANTRHVGGPIESTTVARLERAWSVPLNGKSIFGAHAAQLVVVDGVAYSQDLRSNVQAIDVESGAVLWTHAYESPSLGPNGVVVAGGRVFGATAKAAFALDRASGAELWSETLTSHPDEGIDMAPGYRDGVVYVSTVPVSVNGLSGGGAIGVLWALDASSGARLWRFNTVPEDLWGNPEVNSGGGLWYQPSFDEAGAMYFGVGNPAPFPGTEEFPWGSSRPGPNLYTNSMVKLDAASGALRWHYQQTPHDLYDWDFQDPPLLIDAGGKQLAIGAGKVGVVVALERETGEPVWSAPVGLHNGHDEDSILAMEGRADELTAPVTIFPGQLGGVIAPMASDGSKLFVPVVNGGTRVASGFRLEMPLASSGALVALDLASGTVEWERELPSAALGAPLAVNDIVFATTYDGTVYALDGSSGAIAWERSLPAGANAGVTVAGDTLIASAGVAGEGEVAQLIGYRLAETTVAGLEEGDDSSTQAPPPPPPPTGARSAHRPARPATGRSRARAGRIAVLRRGRIALRMRCRGSRPCRGRAHLVVHRRVLARFAFRIAPGRRVAIRARARVRALRRLPAKRGRLRAVLRGRGLQNRAVTLKRGGRARRGLRRGRSTCPCSAKRAWRDCSPPR